jgi:hypothetical protein
VVIASPCSISFTAHCTAPSMLTCGEVSLAMSLVVSAYVDVRMGQSGLGLHEHSQAVDPGT